MKDICGAKNATTSAVNRLRTRQGGDLHFDFGEGDGSLELFGDHCELATFVWLSGRVFEVVHPLSLRYVGVVSFVADHREQCLDAEVGQSDSSVAVDGTHVSEVVIHPVI